MEDDFAKETLALRYPWAGWVFAVAGPATGTTSGNGTTCDYVSTGGTTGACTMASPVVRAVRALAPTVAKARPVAMTLPVTIGGNGTTCDPDPRSDRREMALPANQTRGGGQWHYL